MESFDLITGKWSVNGDLFTEVSRPALTKKDNTIYLFENGIVFTYNIVTRELKEYHVNLFLKASKMYFVNKKLIILGGFYDREFSVQPSNGVFSIDLDEFENTRIHNIKKL